MILKVFRFNRVIDMYEAINESDLTVFPIENYVDFPQLRVGDFVRVEDIVLREDGDYNCVINDVIESDVIRDEYYYFGSRSDY